MAASSSKEEIGRAEQRGCGEPSACGDHTTQHWQEKRTRNSGRGKRMQDRELERKHL
jgi:hypothetical protein